MVVGPTSGDVFVFGCKDGKTPAFFVYKAGGLENINKIGASCKHYESIYMLAFSVDDKDKVLKPCWECRDIKLLDSETGRYDQAFDVQSYYPMVMCQGESDNIYVKHRPYRGSDTLLVLNRQKSQFCLATNPINVDTFLEKDQRMVLLSPDYIVISSYLRNCFVRAISCDTGKT